MRIGENGNIFSESIFVETMPNDISSCDIGIIGGGHLGRSLAKALLNKSAVGRKLKMSFSGNPETLYYLEREGLDSFISTNATIAAECNIVFIAIRPADLQTLKGIEFGVGRVIISCMAGCARDSLEKILRHKVIRIMPSSPVTIDEGKAVCALYPQDNSLQQLLAATGFTIYSLSAEQLFNIFTGCVCLPAAFLQMEIGGTHFSSADVIGHFSGQFAEFEKLFHWAYGLTPFQLPLQEKLAYINRMATKGGITEAIINSLKSGDRFIDAIQSGINRGDEISKGFAY